MKEALEQKELEIEENRKEILRKIKEEKRAMNL